MEAWIQTLPDSWTTQLPADDSAFEAWTISLSQHTLGIGIFSFEHQGGSFSAEIATAVAAVMDHPAHASGVVLILRSGGARVQDGVPALWGMHTMLAARNRMANASRPLVVICQDPTMGGTASTLLATADVSFALPDTRIGFTGRSASEVTGQPARIEKAEALYEQGQIDHVCSSDGLKCKLVNLLNCLVANTR